MSSNINYSLIILKLEAIWYGVILKSLSIQTSEYKGKIAKSTVHIFAAVQDIDK